MIALFLHRNPRILLLVVGVIVVAGGTAFSILPRLEDPILGKRVAVVSTVYPGADAGRVEALVTTKLEKALRPISEIKQIRSNSRAGISNLTIELDDSTTDFDPIWSLVRDSVQQAQAELPGGSLPPEVEVFPLKAFAAIIAVRPTSLRTSQIFLRRLSRRLRGEIARIPGTESVHLFGDPGEEFAVDVHSESLAETQLSIGAIAQQIAADRTKDPAGTLRSEEAQLSLDLADAEPTAEQIAATVIRSGARGDSLLLADLADVTRRTLAVPADIALVDGHPAIVLGVHVKQHVQLATWSEQLNETIRSASTPFAADADVEVIFSQREFVEARLRGLTWSLVLGTAAVIAVVCLLMGWRSMLVVGLTLPLSVLGVFAAMRAMAIPIHQMSVTGLIVALGLLIDNAIVVVEDIRGRILGGDRREPAIVAGVRHLAMPLFGSTLTTALAFLPIATLPGPPGEFVGTIAVSVILAICASFSLAMTVVPALLGLMHVKAMGKSWLENGIRNRYLHRVYSNSLDATFRFPLLGVLLGMTLPCLGYWVAADLPRQFFPPSDREQVQIEVELPARSPLDRTLETVLTMHDVVETHAAVRRVHWFLGRSAPTFYYNVVPRRRGTPFYAQAIVDLLPGTSTQAIARELQEQLDSYHNSRVVVRQLDQGPPFDAPIEVRVAGPDLSVLFRLGQQIRLLLSQTPGVLSTRSDFEEIVPKIIVDVDQQAAALAGLDAAEISRQLYASIEGASGGTLLVGGEAVPIKVRTKGLSKADLAQLGALRIHPPPPSPVEHNLDGAGATMPVRAADAGVPLSAIASFRLESERAAIIRIHDQRVNEVKAYIQPGILPSQVMEEFADRLQEAKLEIPDGYRVLSGGEEAKRVSAVNSLIANALTLFCLMILTLIVSFRSFRHAFVIICVGAMAIGLGPLSLWLFGFPFGFMAIVGTMGLVGVAINDSIVVLAAIRQDDAARAGDRAALRDVVLRATRHVLATTLTTIVGFLPLIVAGGGFWPPLAITVAGGVGGATILALYFVPSMFLLLHGRGRGTNFSAA